jgi:hypothetical protein
LEILQSENLPANFQPVRHRVNKTAAFTTQDMSSLIQDTPSNTIRPGEDNHNEEGSLPEVRLEDFLDMNVVGEEMSQSGNSYASGANQVHSWDIQQELGANTTQLTGTYDSWSPYHNKSEEGHDSDRPEGYYSPHVFDAGLSDFEAIVEDSEQGGGADSTGMEMADGDVDPVRDTGSRRPPVRSRNSDNHAPRASEISADIDSSLIIFAGPRTRPRPARR